MKFTMPRRSMIGMLIACLLPVAFNASAQRAPTAQEKGPAAKDSLLHELVVQYPTPYQAPEAADVKAVLDRVFNYLDSVTPAKVINKTTHAEITDIAAGDPDAVLMPGDFRLTSYEWGVTYSGMLAAGAATGDKRYTDYAFKRMQLLSDLTKVYYPRVKADRQNSAAPIKSFLNPHALDDAGALCASFMQAKLAGSTTDFSTMLDICGTFVTKKEYRLADGTLARKRPLLNTVWLDDMFMGVPTMAYLGKTTGERKYYDDAVKQVLQISKRMFNPQLGIYMHGWVEGMKDHPEMHWARANGWAVMAMVEVLEVLPKDHPGYPKVLAQLRAHIKGLGSYQSRIGSWHQLLDRNDSYLETSATAIYAYAIARSVNRGYVDKEMYGPMAILAWNAVANKVNAKGQVEDICVGTGMAFDPAFYYYRPVSTLAAHGYGPVLLAGAEITTLTKNHKFGLNDSGFMYQGPRQ
ncbi:glycoside hydrolase family 88/105 protein [Pseudoduganella namucuonensis]|uniref:Rhamnogalacturonyl hydrolase YesR n=1 Tax=Pseudoduganella namucuonensis TaxID=1035707 RepID=A0A1I7K2H3_9BURK|nr:glycoside hydrolase family 88 protein [Pseudoduganella namucuonensis]SFU91555.1 Rhamnogalacturonyl hydrolase YesR [Pseudoduganella namucuonensis]